MSYIPTETAYDWITKNKSMKVLSSGCKKIDSVIGGYPVGSITEVAGEAGCGKTQMMLCLALQCQLPIELGGLNSNVAYLSCGEGEFPIKRLNQLAKAYALKSNNFKTSQEFLDGVKIEQCHTAEQLRECLKSNIPKVCRQPENINKSRLSENDLVKLIIIDSIAGVFRTDYDTQNKNERFIRQAMMKDIIEQLKMLAQSDQMVVVIVNQVTATGFNDKYLNSIIGLDSNDIDSIPALGLEWAYSMNTRIVLTRDTQAMRAALNNINININININEKNTNDEITQTKIDDEQEENITEVINQESSSSSSSYSAYASKSSKRTLTLQWSPMVPPGAVRYQIRQDGVFSIE